MKLYNYNKLHSIDPVMIKDTAPGIPAHIDPREIKSIGMYTVYLFLEGKLKGKVEVESNDGAEWKIKLPNLITDKRI